ncbi:MAG: pyridoxal-phosphate dependent enzyme [Myxococcales bacterium]|nr:pyridoxal-phosphate dependent enzyme [Myxococcales bacterium]
MLPEEHGFKGLIGDTPMRRLERMVGRDDVTVYGKLEGNNLGGSVKDRAALAMITQAVDQGLLEGRRIVEATSGNTGIALAMIASLMGRPITLVMPESATPERRAVMKAYGAEVLLSDGMEDAIDMARALHEAGTHYMIDQFSNPANPEMHFRTTGPEIWRDTAGQVTHFVASMGTTGTIMGTGKFLKAQNPALKVVGVQPQDGHQIPGSRKWPEAYLPKIYKPEGVDEILFVDRPTAEDHVLRMTREEGVFAGISSGGACWGALEVAKTAPPGAVIVFIVCDRGDKYLSVPGLFEA